METRYLRSFLKIAESGSISRAAESLGIAQPSLSQQLLRLEDELGLKLFRRIARGVALTEADYAGHVVRVALLPGAAANSERISVALRGLTGVTAVEPAR